MNKAELIDGISKELKQPKKTVTLFVEEFFKSIENALAKGEKCTFVDFGVFEVKDRAAREGRNPQDPTKIVKIPAKRVAIFRPGKKLKKSVLFICRGYPVRNREEACLNCANLRERSTKIETPGKCTVYPKKIPNKIYYATGKNNGCQYFIKR